MKEFLERAAAALLALTTLFALWTVGVLGLAMLSGTMETSASARAFAMSALIAGAGFAAVWLLRRTARRLPSTTPADHGP